MLARVVFAAGIGLALAVVPAQAQNDVEAKAETCASCHGQSGVPINPNTVPVIWGQQASYIVKQLHDFRSGDRETGVMAGVSKGLSQADLRPLANYFAAKSWPAKQSGAVPSASPPAILARCAACHQTTFEGGPPAPRLAGLSYEYLLAQMKAFKNGARSNNEDMPKILEPLSDSDIDALAKYLAAL
jgi:cytochrome c553